MRLYFRSRGEVSANVSGEADPDLTRPTILAGDAASVLAGSDPGDWVLDPFFGAGTVGVVCERLGRRCVGIEINPEYVALARERLRIE